MEPVRVIPWSTTYKPTSKDDLVHLTNLLSNDASSFFGLLSQDADDDRAINLPVPDLTYLEPTIKDTENALSIAPKSKDLREHKYSLRIKSCGGNMVCEDGYKWRKYGQKFIKNSPKPRSYYRCSNPRCGAKKQVERSIEDPDTFIITYEGLHLHFAYPFFIMGQTPQAQSPTKKPKTIDPEPEAQKSPDFLAPEATGPQGLLEDMVPWMIRNPSSNQNALSNSSSCSSYRSPPTSPPSPSTCPSCV